MHSLQGAPAEADVAKAVVVTEHNPQGSVVLARARLLL
jgi:hypothetical protein